MGGRGRSVLALLDLAARGVRSTAGRMPRTVHNEGKGGFAGLLTDAARRSGVSGYPGDGTQRWPAVHALDLDGQPATRIVLGDWYQHGSVLRVDGDGVELRGL